jgi:hypothetical protein
MNDGYEPIRCVSLRLRVRAPKSTETLYHLRPQDDNPGFTRTAVSTLETGAHQIVAELTAESGEKQRAERTADVPSDDSEIREAWGGRKALETLAKRTGGLVVDGNDRSGILNALPGGAVRESDHRQIDLWQSPWFFAAIALLASANWYLRKRGGLA